MPIPAPPTVKSIITTALRKAGVVGLDEVIEDPMLNEALADYNDLIAQWNVQRFMIYHLRTYSTPSTGAESYAVGVGQLFNTPGNPPDRIESAFLRQVNGTGNPNSAPFDWPLRIIPAVETYNLIRLKRLGTFARAVFYETSFPIAYIKPWPLPQSSIYEIHITFKDQLLPTSNVNDQVVMPPVYTPATKFCLARRYRTAYQIPPDPEVNALARAAVNAVRLANVQIPLAVLPSAVLNRGGAYNYRSDTP